MKYKDYLMRGLPLLRIPITGANKVNNRGRDVRDLGDITAAQLIHEADIMRCRSTLYCGKLNKAFPILRHFGRASERPVVLLTASEYTYERAGAQLIFNDYCIDSPSQNLPDGNGNVYVKNEEEIIVDMIEMIAANPDRAFVFIAADGLHLTRGILSALERTWSHMILTDRLEGARGIIEDNLGTDEIVGRSKVLLFYPCSDAERFLIPILPKYECEKPRNELSLGYHNHSGGGPDPENYHISSGLGLNISQSRELSVEPVINGAQLKALREKGQMVIYNTESQQVLVGRITR